PDPSGVRGPGSRRRARPRTALRRREQRGWCRACSLGTWSLRLGAARAAALVGLRGRGSRGGIRGARWLGCGSGASLGGLGLGLGFALGFAAGARGFAVRRGRGALLFLAVFAVVGDVEAGAFEDEA